MDASVSLPTELLEDIFEYAAGFKRSTSLGRFALVCRTWRQPAQRALFTTVVLKSGRQARGWLASPLREHYRAKHFEFGLWTSISLGGAVLEAAPGASLTLNHSLDNTQSAYHLVTSPQAAGLQRLCLRWLAFFPTHAVPLTCRLRHLEMPSSSYTHTFTFRSILHPSRDTLETLNLTGGDLTALIQTLAVIGPFHRVNHLILGNVYPLSSVKPLLSFFPSLSRLEAGYSDGLVDAIVETPTACLEALSFDTRYLGEAWAAKFLELLKQPHLAGLTRIAMPSTDRGVFERPRPQEIALLEECKERSISLQCRFEYL
ncbi:hypothetical protein RQP46_009620 [Phenoliferia psychrophenolica]